MMTTEVNRNPLPWQSLKDFTASTTSSEKVWRVVNNLIFAAAGLAIVAIISRKIRLAPPALSYASYAVIALAVRKIASTLIGYAAYPATITSHTSLLSREEDVALQDLNQKGFVTQKISLHKSGVTYDAILIGHQDTIANGKWSIHALGNGMAMEQLMDSIPGDNKIFEANTLLINGPGVGHSQGYPTRYQMGAGFEAGLQFLEKEVKATHIVLQGLSLGGGMMAEATLAHEFDTTTFKYLAISDRTFSRLSAIATAIVGFTATVAFFLTGAELDTIAGAEKLKQLKIEHIIIQHDSKDNCGADGVIPDRVALAAKLEKTPTRTFLLSSDVRHLGNLPLAIAKPLLEKMETFFASA
jgi:hypothetical protein